MAVAEDLFSLVAAAYGWHSNGCWRTDSLATEGVTWPPKVWHVHVEGHPASEQSVSPTSSLFPKPSSQSTDITTPTNLALELFPFLESHKSVARRKQTLLTMDRIKEVRAHTIILSPTLWWGKGQQRRNCGLTAE